MTGGNIHESNSNMRCLLDGFFCGCHRYHRSGTCRTEHGGHCRGRSKADFRHTEQNFSAYSGQAAVPDLCHTVFADRLFSGKTDHADPEAGIQPFQHGRHHVQFHSFRCQDRTVCAVDRHCSVHSGRAHGFHCCRDRVCRRSSRSCPERQSFQSGRRFYHFVLQAAERGGHH